MVWRSHVVVCRLVVASFVLLACQNSQRPRATPTPPTAPPAPTGDVPKGSLEQEAKPADGKAVEEFPTSFAAPAVERSNAASFALWRAFTHPANFVASPHG